MTGDWILFIALAGVVTRRLGATTVLTVQSAAYVVAGLFALQMLGAWPLPWPAPNRLSAPAGD